MLRDFLDFRQEVVTRRFQFELAELERRIHILEGFETIFDVLDETIRIIRKSDGKADAAAKLMKRFELDEVQIDAILELKLYKLARLEILLIREELREKRGRAKEIATILGDKTQAVEGDPRRAQPRSPRSSPTSGAPRSAAPAATTSSSTPRPSSSTRTSR